MRTMFRTQFDLDHPSQSQERNVRRMSFRHLLRVRGAPLMERPSQRVLYNSLDGGHARFDNGRTIVQRDDRGRPEALP